MYNNYTNKASQSGLDLHTKALMGVKFIEMRDIMMGTKADLNIMHYS